MRALCVLHDAFSTSGLVGQVLRERGWEVDEVVIVPAERYAAPNIEFTLPDSAGYDLLVPMGAPWAAYDDEAIGAWLLPELRWIADAVQRGGAVFGICFGGQALARALGGTVARAAEPEIGWTPVDAHEPALVGPGPWFEWHFDAFTPPPGAVELARSQNAVQAYRIGRSLGVQFHPEVTTADVRLWLDSGGEQQVRELGIDPDELLAECDRQAAGARERAEALVDAYLTKVFAA